MNMIASLTFVSENSDKAQLCLSHQSGNTFELKFLCRIKIASGRKGITNMLPLLVLFSLIASTQGNEEIVIGNK